MHYYKKNIGDYAKKAGRLSMLQHGADMLLIDACYDREIFPTLEEAIDWTWASSTQEVEAVQFVLAKFFTKTDDVFIQKRIQEEIELYREKSATNKRIAIERETKRAGKSTKRVQVVHEPPPNQEPRTINHKPITNKKNSRFKPPSIEEVKAYCDERMNHVDPQNFIDHYQTNDWMRGKNKVKDWKACVRTWEKNAKPRHSKQHSDITEQNINTIGDWIDEQQQS